MPIERNQTDLKLYYAVMNEDGTYGELIPLNKTQRIEIEWGETGEKIQ